MIFSEKPINLNEWNHTKNLFSKTEPGRKSVFNMIRIISHGTCIPKRRSFSGSEAGEIFVHRNIANLVIHTDLNVSSVIQYAVEVLKVKTIIVCGHYGCGGVRAAMSNNHYGLLNKWLRNIKDTYRFHREELEQIEDLDDRADRLTELNVAEQCLNLAKSSIIQKAWHEEQRPTILGWVYHIKNGLLDEVCKMDHTSKIDPIYQYVIEKELQY
jgi:carbonic anhydrase